VHQRATQADIVITTALIPGRAPVLLAEDTVKQMKPGSVVVDLAPRRAATAR
jgi:NAD(P) transhydrogenase subunit alpha